MNTARIGRFGVNPLPWILGDGAYRLDRGVVSGALNDLRHLGLDAMTLEIPAEMSPTDYIDLFAEARMKPAPGYFSGPFDDPTAHGSLVDGILRHAELHLEAGLDRAFIAGSPAPARRAVPAVGQDLDPDRTRIVADGLAAAAEAAAALGVSYALHPHIGTWIEVEDEIRIVLDTTAGSALSFGPDTGHLAWAGINPAKITADYADRVIAVRIKDVDGQALAESRSQGSDYRTAVHRRHVWTEPGRGIVDFAAFFGALPAGWDGWTVLEVDVPNIGDRLASTKVSRDWITQQSFFAGNNGMHPSTS